uniref:Calcium-transporting ATPase 2 n=1 Tax=Bionectria ochroleuca TaxID=29856 RepID=A0A8H7K4I6_BIOOC
MFLTSQPTSEKASNDLTVPTVRPKADSGVSSGTAHISSSDGQKTGLALLETQPGNADALQPSPGDEPLFNISKEPFAFSPGQLGKLINPKSLAAFGGLSVDEKHPLGTITFEQATSNLVAAGQRGSPHHTPINLQQSGNNQPHSCDGEADCFIDRKRVFGTNKLPDRKSTSFLRLVLIALRDRVLILLSIAAVISLALGLYQTFGQTHDEGAKVEWVEGVAIITAVAIVVIVGALNDWQKERQFRKLNAKKEDRLVKVIRSGKAATVSVHDVLVGDVMLVEPGDIIPVDGVFINGHSLSCDESSVTGESDLMKKNPGDEVMRSLLQEEAPNRKELDPFILSGAKVLDGVGSFLVTAVGRNSSLGRTMMALRDDPGLTPLQSKLNVLAGYIAKLGSAAGGLLFLVLFIEFLVRLPNDNRSPEEKGQSFLQILITAITIIVVAVPEGLPLAVTLSLAFATKRMTKENNLVRHLQSCETMGNATVICSDKTGTLTENVMTVVSGALGEGGQVRFGGEQVHHQTETGVLASGDDQKTHLVSGKSAHVEKTKPAIQVSIGQLSSTLGAQYRDLLRTAIAVNTTAFEGEEEGRKTFIGTKTETALLDWIRRCFSLGPLEIERANHSVKQLFPFTSNRKCMGAVIELPGDGDDEEGKKYRLFIKGAPEIVLSRCASTLTLSNPTKALASAALTDAHKQVLSHITSGYAVQSLRTLALAYRDFPHWPPETSSESSSCSVELDDVFQAVTWIGIIGIKDPVRQSVAKAVEDCRSASVTVKMVTGDNIETARAIAQECGILKHGEPGLVMEGSEFHQLSGSDRAAAVKDIRVLARASPEDKRILVKTLRNLGEIVAVTGDGTNDAPALKAADIGFSMGIAGTEVAKEASDIILMDDNFSSIVKALAWGRAINDSVKKFLQFQLTVNITAVIITFVSAVSDDEGTPVLNAVQLLWSPPPEARASKRVYNHTSHVEDDHRTINLPVDRLLCLVVCRAQLPRLPGTGAQDLHFQRFVFMQIFKLVNSRRIDNQLNIFEGLHRNYWFMFMMFVMTAGQLIIIFFGGDAFVVVQMNGTQWALSVTIGFFSIPIGVLIRLFPDRIIERSFQSIKNHWPSWLRFRRKSKTEDDLLPVLLDAENYSVDTALFAIIDDLALLEKVRSGSFLNQRRVLPMVSAVGMPGVVAASVGGLLPSERLVSRTREAQNLTEQ